MLKGAARKARAATVVSLDLLAKYNVYLQAF